jgi:hypothetical protein
MQVCVLSVAASLVGTHIILTTFSPSSSFRVFPWLRVTTQKCTTTVGSALILVE